MEDRETPIFTTPPPPPQSSVPIGGGEGAVLPGGYLTVDLDVKKSRGRPRKYDADGNLNPGYKTPKTTGTKRGRGKVSGGWEMSPCFGELSADTAGRDFTPHVVIVQAGEDVLGKIIALSQKSPRGVCVLSANGQVSNVTIRQPGNSGGLLTYEGRFEILCLKGSFTVSETSGMNSRMGGLTVSLAGPDGRVIGGGLAGLLTAASPIQMVVGSFIQNGISDSQKRKKYNERRTTSLTPSTVETVIPATPISEAAPNTNICPLPATQIRVHSYRDARYDEAPNMYGQNKEAPNNYGEALNDTHNNNDDDKYMSEKQNINTSSDSGEWNISDPNTAQRSYPDINVSLLVD